MSTGYPLATSPSVLTPGHYLSVDLLAGLANTAGNALRCLLIAPRSSAGTLAPDSGLAANVAGPDAVKITHGPGTPAHLAAQALFRAHGLASVDVVAPAASSGVTASGTITFAGTVTASMTIQIRIKGIEFLIPWFVGETPTVAAAKAVAAINSLTDLVPVIASNVAGVLTLTAKIAGAWGNDVVFSGAALDGTGGTIANSGTRLASGTLEPDFTSVLSLVESREYDYILSCVSNAETYSASATSNPGRVKTHINTYKIGKNALLQQQILASTGSPGSAITGAVALNHTDSELLICTNALSLGCEFAGWEAGRRMKVEQDDPNPNRCGEAIEGLYGALDLVADKLTAIEVELLMHNGLSVIDYTGRGAMFLVQPITTHSQDSNGNPDLRCFGVEQVSGSYAWAKDLRTTIPAEFAGAKIVRDLTPGDEPPPAGVSEERDVRAFVLSRADSFVARGVLRRDVITAAIAAGTLIVQVNDVNESQVDIVFPFGVVVPLTKFSTVLRRVK